MVVEAVGVETPSGALIRRAGAGFCGCQTHKSTPEPLGTATNCYNLHVIAGSLKNIPAPWHNRSYTFSCHRLTVRATAHLLVRLPLLSLLAVEHQFMANNEQNVQCDDLHHLQEQIRTVQRQLRELDIEKTVLLSLLEKLEKRCHERVPTSPPSVNRVRPIASTSSEIRSGDIALFASLFRGRGKMSSRNAGRDAMESAGIRLPVRMNGCVACAISRGQNAQNVYTVSLCP